MKQPNSRPTGKVILKLSHFLHQFIPHPIDAATAPYYCILFVTFVVNMLLILHLTLPTYHPQGHLTRSPHKARCSTIHNTMPGAVIG